MDSTSFALDGDDDEKTVCLFVRLEKTIGTNVKAARSRKGRGQRWK